jgi:hypothetical protein
VHAEARRMPGSDVGGGRREEPWHVVALVRALLSCPHPSESCGGGAAWRSSAEEKAIAAS